MEKQSIKAIIIADSIERIGNNRITTWQLTYPRFIHSEIMTHRILSKNSASSRAIPFKKMVEQVENDPFIPIKWMKDHSGMQGEEYLEDFQDIEDAINDWLIGRDKAVESAKSLNSRNITKQICNRKLETYLWHTIILTGTEFENFFALRAHPAAEIHLQDLAYKMLDAYNISTPKELKEGEWHIPFIDEIETEDFGKFLIKLNQTEQVSKFSYKTILDWETSLKVQISTAKCAQVSYMKFGSDNYEDLIDLHNSLLIRPYEGKRGIRTLEDPIHASPAEHCAQAMTQNEYESWYKGEGANERHVGRLENHGWCHNLRGFKSYRSMLPNENATDIRVIKK